MHQNERRAETADNNRCSVRDLSVFVNLTSVRSTFVRRSSYVHSPCSVPMWTLNRVCDKGRIAEGLQISANFIEFLDETSGATGASGNNKGHASKKGKVRQLSFTGPVNYTPYTNTIVVHTSSLYWMQWYMQCPCQRVATLRVATAVNCACTVLYMLHPHDWCSQNQMQLTQWLTNARCTAHHHHSSGSGRKVPTAADPATMYMPSAS